MLNPRPAHNGPPPAHRPATPAWRGLSPLRTQPDEPQDVSADGPEFEVARTPRSVALVRRYCVQACSDLGWADAADTVELLVSELATNTIVHATGARVRVRVLDRGLRLRVEVSDDSLTLPLRRSAAASSENGRGLAMIDALAVDAGCDVAARGKTAWFEVGI